jgi:hypothetical protein
MLPIEPSSVILAVSGLFAAVCMYKAYDEQSNKGLVVLEAVAKYNLHPYCELYHHDLNDVRLGLISLSESKDLPSITFSRDGLTLMLEQLETIRCTQSEYGAIMYLKGLKDSLDYQSPKPPMVFAYPKLLKLIAQTIGEFSPRSTGVV